MRQDIRLFGFITAALIFIVSTAAAQNLNKVVFGPLEGDEAGVLTVHNGENVEIEMWVRTDPNNPAPIVGVSHCLMSADSVVASRDGAVFDPDYGSPCWETLVFPPFGHDEDPTVPEGHTIQIAAAIYNIFYPTCDPLDTNGEWDYFGSFLMTCNTDVPVEDTYYPFSDGWIPHGGRGTSWSFDNPPGGSIIPDQGFCGLYFEPTAATGEENRLPEKFWLAQNHPNPFNARTTIKYSLPDECRLSIQIYDLLGRKVETLISGYQPAGWHSVVWDAGDNPSGVYFYRIKVREYTETKSCLLLK